MIVDMLGRPLCPTHALTPLEPLAHEGDVSIEFAGWYYCPTGDALRFLA